MNKMNQTQTRSPRKRLLSLILAVILMIGLLPISAFATSASAQANDAEDTGYEYNIMFLDCGRKYFSVNSIKQIIDNASAAGFNYIQLAVGNDGLRFLLDDMSLTVNGTTYSSQQVSAAIHAGNEAYYNFDVDELTQPEMDEIITYAASKGMGVIPCVNTPGHMDAILSAATSLTGKTCSYRGSTRTIDVTNTTAVAFTQALLQKYISYFAGKGCKLFNMGADEYANDKYTTGSMGFGNLQDTGNYSYYVTYVNAVAKMVKAAGMTPMAFNDGIYFNSNTSGGTFDTDILICYWSNGWSGYTPMPAANLAAKGFKLINTNGSYYWVLGKSDAQCSASKASGFNHKTFPGGTINDPAGSMFCIWADYPGAETEASVISKTAATIAAFGKVLPKVKPVEGVKNVTRTDDTTGVSVTAPGLTGLTVKEAKAPSIDTAAEGKVLAYDVTPTTESGNYAEAASVSFKTPSGWDTSRVRGFVVNTDGTVTDGLTGVVENGSFTFTAPHFSVMGIYQLSADAPTKTKDINVAVGGTATVTIDGDYSGTQLDDAVATVTGVVGDKQGKTTYEPATLAVGSFYVSTKSGDTAPTVQLTFENAGNGQYYIKSGDDYVYPDASYTSIIITGWWNYEVITAADNRDAAVKIEGNSDGSIVISRAVTSSGKSGTAYLTLSGTTFGAGESGTKLYLYEPQTTFSGKETTLTFTGKSAGDTSVTIDGVKYNIHVTAEDLTKVTPLTIEYWITNSRLTGVPDNSNEKVIKATDDGIATETGVETSALVAPTGTKDGRHQEYWQTKILDVEKANTSTSGTELQTTANGDDETLNGSAFSKVRYWGGVWQVYTTEWVNVDRTTVTVETYTGDKNQLVAYYMEVVDITNKDGETEMHVNAADWGTKGDGTGNWGYTPESDRCSVSIQMVYEDGSTNPSNITADALKSKTFVYGYWNGGRGLGTMIFNGQGDYQILKVTAETGTMRSSASGSNTVTVTNFTWSNNEEIVWTGGPADSASIGNPARNPSYEAPLDNLAWNTSSGNRNNAILIRVYVKSVPKADSLHVNYFVQGSTTPFYDYAINVKANTVFDSAFRRVEDLSRPDTGYLENATVTNYYGASQTVQSDLSKMTEIEAQYRYCDYRFVDATRSDDGKTVNLYYTFSSTRNFVVDFGLPLVIRPADVNDRLSGNGVNLTGIEVTNKTSFASITTDASKNITYSLNKMIDQMDTFSVQYTGHIKDGQGNPQSGTVKYTLTIIPASNVYYEDSLATFTNGSGAAQNAVWSTVGNDGNAATEKTGVYQALQELGKGNNRTPYGNDDAYNETNSSMLSMGTAHKVTVTANMANTDAWKAQSTSAWPTAQFTFKGTGFDIISLTNNKSGTIFVDVTNTATGKQYNYVVNNYYGYTYQSGEWVVDKNASDTLYQIPVMKVDGLDYGEYNVVIKVAYNKFFDTAEAKEYSFLLDAVRIYDPMGEYADYTKDNEGYPQYIKLRDTLVDGTAKPDGTDKTVFIDGGSTADIKTTYANYGPNNEVYLMKGQAITFKIPANDKIASIQIGAKAPKGTANLNVNEKEIVSGGLSTATEMYYQIATVGGQFTITNTGDGILSLTNLKITYSAKSSVSLGTLNTQEQENAVSLVRALFTAPVATFSPETFQADWGRAVRAGKRATLTVKTSADVESITVDGQSITGYTTRTQRTGWGWWSPKVTYHVFTYTTTAPAQTTDYAVCAVNAEGTASEAVTATLTVKPTTWWNWWF